MMLLPPGNRELCGRPLQPLLLVLLLGTKCAVVASATCWCASGACAEAPLGTVCGIVAAKPSVGQLQEKMPGASPTPAPQRIGGVDAFLGVRYATIPKRFSAAIEASEAWPDPYMATALAPVCFVHGGWKKPSKKKGQGNLMSEDW
jgi:hypothetical protein